MQPPPSSLSLPGAVELQDHLLIASHDLERLAVLLANAGDALLAGFGAANAALAERGDAAEAARHLAGAVTALQFQDLAAQLIAHTRRRLAGCAAQLARDVLPDEHEDPALAAEDAPPLAPNPVTQSEMEAGSVELF